MLRLSADGKNLPAGRSYPDYPRNTSPTPPATGEEEEFLLVSHHSVCYRSPHPQPIRSAWTFTFTWSQLCSRGGMRDAFFICHTHVYMHTKTQEICLFFLSKPWVRLRAELKQDANDRAPKQTRVRKSVALMYGGVWLGFSACKKGFDCFFFLLVLLSHFWLCFCAVTASPDTGLPGLRSIPLSERIGERVMTA